MKKRKIEQFNMVIVGTGGQGLLTLLQIVAEAALKEGYQIKTSELHGLSQRGGSVEVHARFGKTVHSPLVTPGKAHLVLGLEMQECLKATRFANPKTIFLINKFTIPIPGQKPSSESEILKILKKFTENLIIIPAADTCQKEVGTAVTSGVYLLSLAAFKDFIPLKSASILKAIQKVIPKKYLELNEKTFALAKKRADKGF